MENPSKKVLITGSTGLIGKYAIKPLLNLGYEIFATTTKNQEQNKTGINWVRADLLNLDNVKRIFEEVKPQYLLHFAWDTTPGSYLTSNLNFDWFQSSFEMLKQFKINGGERAVYAGTCFEYEFLNSPLKEYGELNPTHVYSKCKNLLNQIATLYAEKNDLSFGWGRIFYVFGENEQEKRLIPVVINSLKEDKVFSTAAGDLIKDYMFAGDIAEAFVKFLDSDVKGSVNICTGEPTAIKEIITLIAKKMNKQHLIKFEGQLLDQPSMIVGDNLRLTNEVKYIPSHTLEEGIKIVLGN